MIQQTLKVLKGGVLSTIQDLGRKGMGRFGLSTCGAADHFALQVGNILVGNTPGAAAIEATLAGLELEVLTDSYMAFTGGDLHLTINRQPQPPWTARKVFAGDLLHFHGGPTGCRAYVCMAGGVAVPEVFHSRSTDLVAHIGGFEGRALLPGDVIDTFTQGPHTFRTSTPQHPRRLAPGVATYLSNSPTIRILPGPQVHHFTKLAWETLLSESYAVSPESNRMGLRLTGKVLHHNALGADILSEAVPEGSIQVPADGQPILLLADRRTVGGYAKIAVATTVDLPKLGQVRPGDTLQFQLVSTAEARELLVKQVNWLNFIRSSW